MDVSPVRSSSKCSSDFSIERILSDESTSRGQAEVPGWLCCTRYQPPRIPRAASSACRARRSGRHARVPFTAAQAAALEAAYARAHYLAPPALRALAAALQLRDDRIKIWFQNRRARERRERSGKIAPPREVPLAPTALFRAGPATWSRASSGVNIMLMKASNTLQNPNERDLENEDSMQEHPRDLTVVTPATPMYLPCPKMEAFGYERADTPLDVESIED